MTTAGGAAGFAVMTGAIVTAAGTEGVVLTGSTGLAAATSNGVTGG